MRYVSRTAILYALVAAVLLAVLPGAILTIIRTGDPYLFTEGFFHDVLARLSGPGRLRFVIQPSVAIFLGLRSGMKDAHDGLPPFLWALAFHREHRSALLRSGLVTIRDLVAVAILLDVISQFLIFKNVRPGAALLVGPVLITFPYAVTRALANRVMHKQNYLAPTTHTR